VGKEANERNHYPGSDEIERWLAAIWQAACDADCRIEELPLHGFSHRLGIHHAEEEFRYIRFTIAGQDPFYAYWQPAASAPAPLLVHVPGYGSEISTHPELAAIGFHVLHVSPLGYGTPEGPDESMFIDGIWQWPVLPDTIASSATRGYNDWLMNVAVAVRWATSRSDTLPNRVSFFGTSQGGGASLLLGSLFRDRGVRCVAADLPYLTNFPLADGRGGYHKAWRALDKLEDRGAGWRGLGYIDTLSHADRLTCPVLLTAGSADDTTPADTIESLFARLPGTRSYTLLNGVGHRYTREFIHLAAAWFRLYA